MKVLFSLGAEILKFPTMCQFIVRFSEIHVNVNIFVGSLFNKTLLK